MPPRPRPRSAPQPRPRGKSAPTDNGAEPLPPELRRYIEAVEELAAARRALPTTAGEPGRIDPAVAAHAERLERKIGDIEAIGSGPQPSALAELSEPHDADAWLVEGFIRPGTLVMVTGLPSAGKSWAARQLAIGAGVGGPPFLGHYAIARPLRTLLVDEDNGDRDEWRREETLCAFLGVERARLGGVHRTSLAGVELDQERWQTWLRAQIVALELDLVILDPISEMHGGKELRDDPGFRSMLRFLRTLKTDFPQLATLIVHHNRKREGRERGAPSTIEDVRGQWGQTPDVVAIMRAIADRRIHWDLFKRVPHSSLLLEQQPGGGLKAVADETTAATRRQTSDSRVLASIDAGAETADEIEAGTGMSSSGVYKVLKRLGQAGIISKRAPYARVRDRDDPIDEPLE